MSRTLNAMGSGQRNDHIDALKGVGIVLVVLGHALDGALKANLLSAQGLGQVLHFSIYLFHMPLFFLLSALFVQRRIAQSASSFLSATARRLLWPFVLWSVVQSLAIAAAGGLVNAPVEVSAKGLLAMLWMPPAQFWFLHCLLLFHVLASWVVRRFGAAALLLVAAALLLFNATGGSLPWTPLNRYVPFLVFYACGVLCGEHGLSAWMARWTANPEARTLSVASVLLFLVAAQSLHTQGVLPGGPATLGAQSLGIIATMGGVCVWMAPSVLRLAAWLGRRTMAIFLLHILFAAAARIALNKGLHIQDGALVVVFSTVCGVLLPCAALALARRLKWANWLGLA